MKSHFQDERPREKLYEHGGGVLSNTELIAILLSSGNKLLGVLELARILLLHYDGDISLFARSSIEDLMRFKGIGLAKASILVGAFELSLRLSSPSALDKCKVGDSSSAYSLFRPKMAYLNVESFWVAFLNQKNVVIKLTQLSKGGFRSTVADIRLLLKKALLHNAASFIVAHNHPSGCVVPSNLDKKVTKSISEGARTLDIKFWDHIIVASDNFFSFADEGLL